jgi:hypothetical protein
MSTSITGHYRPIHQIAEEINREWTRPYFGAVPYIRALMAVSNVHDSYGADPVTDLIRYFLSNATTWRGDVARRIKAELKTILKEV